MTAEVRSEAEIAGIVRLARTVAVLGMKDERSRGAPAYEIPLMLRRLGLRVIPVNPRIAAALGEASRPDVAAVGEPVDILNVFRRSDHMGAHVEEILRLPPSLRPKVVWMQTGVRDERSGERLAAAGIRVVMDRCLGVDAERYRGSPAEA